MAATRDLIPKGYICPFLNDLVDALYTEELNALIEKTCECDVDKRTFMMFIMMYFFTFLNMRVDSTNENKKEMLKVFMSELIINTEKRKQCVDLYMLFEKSVEKSVTTGQFLLQG